MKKSGEKIEEGETHPKLLKKVITVFKSKRRQIQGKKLGGKYTLCILM